MKAKKQKGFMGEREKFEAIMRRIRAQHAKAEKRLSESEKKLEALCSIQSL